MKFVRDEKYWKTAMLAGMDDKKVITDAQVRIYFDKGHYRAYCLATKTWLQFPKKLRFPGALLLADVVEVSSSSPYRETFYRVIKNSIRRANNPEEVIG